MVEKKIYDFKERKNEEVIKDIIGNVNNLMIERILKEEDEINHGEKEILEIIDEVDNKKIKVTTDKITNNEEKEINKTKTDKIMSINMNEDEMKEIIKKIGLNKKINIKEEQSINDSFGKKDKNKIRKGIINVGLDKIIDVLRKEKKEKIKKSIKEKIKDKREKEYRENEKIERIREINNEMSNKLIKDIIKEDEKIKENNKIEEEEKNRIKNIKDKIGERTQVNKMKRNMLEISSKVLIENDIYKLETLYKTLGIMYSPLYNMHKRGIKNKIVVINEETGYISNEEETNEEKYYYTINEKFEMTRITKQDYEKKIKKEEFRKKREENKEYDIKLKDIDLLEMLKDNKISEEKKNDIMRIYDMRTLIEMRMIRKIDDNFRKINRDYGNIVNNLYKNLENISNKPNTISYMIECNMVKELKEIYEKSELKLKKPRNMQKNTKETQNKKKKQNNEQNNKQEYKNHMKEIKERIKERIEKDNKEEINEKNKEIKERYIKEIEEKETMEELEEMIEEITKNEELEGERIRYIIISEIYEIEEDIIREKIEEREEEIINCEAIHKIQRRIKEIRRNNILKLIGIILKKRQKARAEKKKRERIKKVKEEEGIDKMLENKIKKSNTEKEKNKFIKIQKNYNKSKEEAYDEDIKKIKEYWEKGIITIEEKKEIRRLVNKYIKKEEIEKMEKRIREGRREIIYKELYDMYPYIGLYEQLDIMEKNIGYSEEFKKEIKRRQKGEREIYSMIEERNMIERERVNKEDEIEIMRREIKKMMQDKKELVRQIEEYKKKDEEYDKNKILDDEEKKIIKEIYKELEEKIEEKEKKMKDNMKKINNGKKEINKKARKINKKMEKISEKVKKMYKQGNKYSSKILNKIVQEQGIDVQEYIIENKEKLKMEIESKEEYEKKIVDIEKGEYKKRYKKGMEKEIVDEYMIREMIREYYEEEKEKEELKENIEEKKEYLTSNKEHIEYNDDIIKKIIGTGEEKEEKIGEEERRYIYEELEEDIKRLNEEIEVEKNIEQSIKFIKNIIESLKKIDKKEGNEIGNKLYKYYIIKYIERNERREDVIKTNMRKNEMYKEMLGEIKKRETRIEYEKIIDGNPYDIADCGETTIRNMINISIIESGTGYLDINRYPKLDKRVEEYYKKYNTNKEQKEVEAGEDWMDIINEIVKENNRQDIFNKFNLNKKRTDIEPSEENVRWLLSKLIGVKEETAIEEMGFKKTQNNQYKIRNTSVELLLDEGHAYMEVDIKYEYYYTKELEEYYKYKGLKEPKEGEIIIIKGELYDYFEKTPIEVEWSKENKEKIEKYIREMIYNKIIEENNKNEIEEIIKMNKINIYKQEREEEEEEDNNIYINKYWDMMTKEKKMDIISTITEDIEEITPIENKLINNMIKDIDENKIKIKECEGIVLRLIEDLYNEEIIEKLVDLIINNKNKIRLEDERNEFIKNTKQKLINNINNINEKIIKKMQEKLRYPQIKITLQNYQEDNKLIKTSNDIIENGEDDGEKLMYKGLIIYR